MPLAFSYELVFWKVCVFVCRIERATSWMALPSLHGCHVLNSPRIAHQMLSNPTLNLIAKMPVRPADQMPNVLFCLALTRFHDRIENSAETTTAALRRLRRCRCDGWRKFAYVNEPFQHFRLPLFTA